MHKLMKKGIHRDQSGMVAIVVTVLMMLIMSIIVIAYANITRREQRQALDRQLSTQAFYAAESGINDAIAALRTAVAAGVPDSVENDACVPPVGHPLTTYSRELDGPTGAISYSCLLVDPSPTYLQFGNINAGQSRVFPVQPDSGSVDNLVVFWQTTVGMDSDYSGCPAAPSGSNPFPVAWPTNCASGPMRIEIVPVAPSFTRADLVNGAMVVVGAPQNNAGLPSAVAYSPPASGTVVESACDPVLDATKLRHCKTVISGLTGSRYYARLTPLYKSAAVSVCASTNTACASSDRKILTNAQALVDSTGKANDVVRRVQAFVDIQPGAGDEDPPSFAIDSSETICKRFSIAHPDTIDTTGGPSCAVSTSVGPIVIPPSNDFYWATQGGNSGGSSYSTCSSVDPPAFDGFDGCFFKSEPSSSTVPVGTSVFARRGVAISYNVPNTITAGLASISIRYRQYDNGSLSAPAGYPGYMLVTDIDGTNVGTLTLTAGPRGSSMLYTGSISIPASGPNIITFRWINNVGSDPDIQIDRVMICRNTCVPAL